MKLNFRQCEVVSFSNGNGPQKFVLISVHLFLKAKNARRKHPLQAIVGSELSQAVNGEYRLALKSEAVAFSEHCARQLGERLVVFPVADASKLVVRSPLYRYKNLPPQSECRNIPPTYLFTTASWFAFVKKK